MLRREQDRLERTRSLSLKFRQMFCALCQQGTQTVVGQTDACEHKRPRSSRSTVTLRASKVAGSCSCPKTSAR
eukprot:4022237-Prymnesium_polylepis.1